MIKYGILGVGHLGRFHAMQAKELTNCQLKTIYDQNSKRAEEVAKELNLSYSLNLDDFFNQVDALSLVTITSTHFEIAKEAIQRGKHVLIEKPITTTVAEADELIHLADKHRVKIQVGHIERFNSALIGIQDFELNPLFVESHRLAPFNVRGTDVPVILDLMIHDIDIILVLVKSPVKSIQASGIPIVSDTEDIANCRIEFENACVANITASRISANKMRKMRIFQSNAYLSLDFNEGSSDIYYIKNKKTENFSGDYAISLGKIDEGKNSKEINYVKHQKLDINPLRLEIQSFVDSINHNTMPLVTAQDGKKALEVASTIIKQIKEYQEKIGFSHE